MKAAKTDKKSRPLLWEKIVLELTSEISDSPLRQLPSEAMLAKRFNVSRSTIRHALQSLKNTGLLRSVQGKGTFLEFDYSLKNYPSLAEVLTYHGFKESSEILKFVESTGIPPAEVAAFFGKQKELMLLKRLRLANETPVAIVNSWITKEVGQRLMNFNLTQGSLESAYSKIGIVITSCEETIAARLATRREINLLKATEPFCVIIHGRKFKSFSHPIEYRQAILNAKVFKFSFEWDKVQSQGSQKIKKFKLN
jgi:GntR family transcriptional regulator